MNYHVDSSRKFVLILNLILSLLIIVVSCAGLITTGFYSAEKMNWQVQAEGQDWVDLVIVVPSLFITSFLSYRRNNAAESIWGGVILYCLYTFVIYCFDVHFNSLFIIYCLCLGLSFYLFLYFLLTHLTSPQEQHTNTTIMAKVIGTYFIFISVLFYALWLSEILPSLINNTTPKSLTESGLPTNPVHVLDLAVVLPALFITGLWLRSRKPQGLMLAPVFLTFFILMDITIGSLVLIMKLRGIDENLAVSLFMGLFALFSLTLLIGYFKPKL